MLLKLILLDRGTEIVEPSQTDDIGNSGVLRLKQLSVKYGRDHNEVSCYLLRLADEIIAAARNYILVKSDVDILTAHRHLDELMSAASLYGPKTLLDDISMAVHILHGFGHSRYTGSLYNCRVLSFDRNCHICNGQVHELDAGSKVAERCHQL